MAMDAAMDPLIAYLEEPGRERFERVVKAHYAFVWRIAFRITRHSEDAADVCQDVFLRLIVRPPSPARVGSARGFLAFQVLSRVDSIRRAARRRLKREEENARRSLRRGLSAEDGMDIADALAILPEDLRIPVELHHFAGLSSREIGEVLGITEQAVTRRIRKAWSCLRRRLAPLGPAALFAALKAEAESAPPPPATLLSDLLRIAEMGGALVPPAAAAETLASIGAGGMIMSAKKIVIVVAAAVIFVTGLWLVNDLVFRKKPGEDAGAPAGAAGASRVPTVAEEASAPPAGERKSIEMSAAETFAGEAGLPPVSLEGKVTDPAGLGIPGACVRAVDALSWDKTLAEGQERFGIDGESAEALRFCRGLCEDLAAQIPAADTDANGRYAFRGLGAAAYRVFVSHSQYLPSADNWAVVEGGAPARCDVRLAPGYVVKGRAIDERGAPVEGATVRARSAESGTLMGWAKATQVLRELRDAALLVRSESTTGSDGSFTLGSLAPARLDVEARKEGLSPAVARVVPPGREDLVLVLRSDPTLAGRVLLPDGRPAAGADVIIEAPRVELFNIHESALMHEIDVLGEKRRATTAGEDGRFRIAGAMPGRHTFRARAKGFPPHVATIDVGNGAIDLGDIVIEKGFSISGSVLDPNGHPAPRIRVAARERRPEKYGPPRREDPLAEAETDAVGGFRLDGLGKGAYEVRGWSAEHGEAVERSVDAGRSDVVLRLGGVLAVKGKVIDAEDERPVAGAKVEIGFEGAHRAWSAEDGTFEIILPKAVQAPAEGDEESRNKIHIEAKHPDYQD